MKFTANSSLLPNGVGGLFAVLLLALLYLANTFDLSFVLGLSSFWQTDQEDVTQYVAGFNLYFNAPWQLPLLAFDSVNFPEGSRVTFVDAIPLYSFLLKLLVPASLAPFNPFGFWIALCFILQATAAWWITRELKINSWSFLLALTFILLFMPSLMYRIGHTSLMSHWLMLFAIALYIRSLRLQTLPRAGWSLLLVAGFYINIYLFTMASAIYLVTMLTVTRLEPNLKTAKQMVISLIPFGILFASLLVTILPLPLSQVQREWGFGYYSMNLLSPFIGGKLFQLQAQITPGQYEGFNYLGIGVLVAFAAALHFHRTKRLDYFSQHKFLLLLMFAFTAYALSSHIAFASTEILHIQYPGFLAGITSQFRVSGRFFWPVGYVVVIFSLVVMFRAVHGKVFVALMLALSVLQLADVRGLHKDLRNIVNRPPVQQMDYAAWDALLGKQVKNIYFYPKFRCATTPHGESILPMMKYISLRDLRINTGYIARHAPPCNQEAQEIAATNPQQSAYVFVQKHYQDEQVIQKFLPHHEFDCHTQDFAYVCLPAIQTEKQVTKHE